MKVGLSVKCVGLTERNLLKTLLRTASQERYTYSNRQTDSDTLMHSFNSPLRQLMVSKYQGNVEFTPDLAPRFEWNGLFNRCLDRKLVTSFDLTVSQCIDFSFATSQSQTKYRSDL